MKDQQSNCSAVLTISCVTFDSDIKVLGATLESLVKACLHAKRQDLLQTVKLHLIDNGPNAFNLHQLYKLKSEYHSNFFDIQVHTGHGNIGYGKGHNLAILNVKSEYHLVLNPDVILDLNNISIALNYMCDNSDVGLLTPDAFGIEGDRQYIAKRHPNILILLARALKISWMNALFSNQLKKYEYRDLIPAAEPIDISLASGCYMLFRTKIVQSQEGFNPHFFMYFEDFELSARINRISRVIHHPALQIIHLGGGASRKGGRHIYYFIVSYIKFVFFKCWFT